MAEPTPTPTAGTPNSDPGTRRPAKSPTIQLVSSSPTQDNTAFPRSHGEKPGPPKHHEHVVRTIRADRYEHQQRTLSTLVLAGTFMAGVEGQILSIILSLEGESKLRTGGMCFAVLGVVNTSFAALYSAVTYIWLKSSWTPGPKLFHEWVAGCVGMMIRWCSSFLVIGTYAGFIALIFFFLRKFANRYRHFCDHDRLLDGSMPHDLGILLLVWSGPRVARMDPGGSLPGEEKHASAWAFPELGCGGSVSAD
ncbi:hypothetical protein MSAN_01951600 [Mycena sanguinolenta]|uniref:Uncharacterized protein n=1 Tax=Mycena sanguinolenta TaxID=230812 RepID=A0A8H6XL78_9AGAR|nr:hypothetical protein MSAN_01951600 [Mycena sanguinolenta]